MDDTDLPTTQISVKLKYLKHAEITSLTYFKNRTFMIHVISKVDEKPHTPLVDEINIIDIKVVTMAISLNLWQTLPYLYQYVIYCINADTEFSVRF